MEQLQFDWINRILRAQKQMVEAYNHKIAAAAGRLGLTKPEADVLLCLANNPDCRNARDVVACRGFSKTYVSRAVDLLSARGYLAAEPCAADRRLQNLHICPAAAEAIRLLRHVQQGCFQQLMAGVPETEMEACQRLFARVMENIKLL